MLLLVPLLSFTPGATAQAAGYDNPACTLTSTNDTAISTTANSNETTVIIFGRIECGNTRATLSSISSCNWVKESNIRVIFAEINFHSQEEVQTFEQGYQCPDITFCYDESYGINDTMYKYAQFLGSETITLPMTVLIDQNNKVQNILTGTKTADELLAEINKINGDNSGETTPPTESKDGFPNFAYGLNTIENTVVSTKADPTKTTVLLFGDVFCNITTATLQDIYDSSWVSSQDIRIIFADVMGNTLDDTKTFAQNFAGKGISFCHDESALNFNMALSYLSLYGHNGGTFPYIVLIDKNDRIRFLTLGYQSPDDIYKEIEKIKDVTPGGTTETPETPEKPNTTDTSKKPETPMSISNVMGLKTSESTAKSVKLTWKKIPEAKGYIIYQYNNSKKTWDTKATLTQNTDSYTVKGLTSGTNYQFAIKAYIQSKDGKQTVSEAYASAYAATAPSAVNFKVTPGKRKATLKWNKVKGATGYTVYYKTNKQKSWKKLKSTKATRYTKTKLKSGTTYTFTVKAYKTYKGKTYTSSFRSKKVKIRWVCQVKCVSF